ncbi:hypothetical protein RRG08_016968 [Elysia crispata]|uniref:Secreted protein n=1 Tax=Elysia crispata TaxID=231223 RepID=A0AAE0XZS7_9GAST|nr:hypothetical protein RRG08_016968 [Elysia crispata]
MHFQIMHTLGLAATTLLVSDTSIEHSFSRSVVIAGCFAEYLLQVKVAVSYCFLQQDRALDVVQCMGLYAFFQQFPSVF